MTDAAAPPVPAGISVWSRVGRWLRSKDPALLVVKRSVRAAVVMPSVFALAHGLFSNPQVALFGAFGSFALLLLVEFTGPFRTRLVSYVGLYVVSSCFIVLGTVVSSDKVAAVVAMGLVGFGVLFAGIVVPQAATASTAALLTFVLSVSISAPASTVGPRMVGWTLAAALCITACLVVWPAPWHDDLRRRLAAAISAVAQLAGTRARGTSDAEAQAAVTSNWRVCATSSPGRPTLRRGQHRRGGAFQAGGPGRVGCRQHHVGGRRAMVDGTAPGRAVTAEVTDTLHQTAALICDRDAHPIDDPERIAAVQDSTRHLDALIGTALRADVSSLTDAVQGSEPSEDGAADREPNEDESLAGALDPGFHARALGIATEMVADATLEAAGARPWSTGGRGWPTIPPARAYAHRLLPHLSFRSVWFRNALRGGRGWPLPCW